MENKKKMLVVGPGFGHNAEAKMKGLNENDKFDVTFLGSQLDYSLACKYPNIRFIPYIYAIRPTKPIGTIYNIIKSIKVVREHGGYDVLYNLGAGRLQTALLYAFTPKKTTKVIEIWSNTILDSAKEKKGIYKGLSDHYVISHSDYVTQFWWGIKEKFETIFPEYSDKFLMYQISYNDIFFSNEQHKSESDFTISFLNSIPDDQIMCFWPRSVIPANNHDLAIDSLNIVKQKEPQLLTNFKLYIWDGNIKNNTLVEALKKKIETYSLLDNVEFVEHPFVSQNDIFAIEERSDMFIQIAREDVLSTFIMEVLCSRKPFILSDIRTFQFLNEKYELDIPLVKNDVNEIANALIDILKNKIHVDDPSATERKLKCERVFSRKNVSPWYSILFDKLYHNEEKK